MRRWTALPLIVLLCLCAASLWAREEPLSVYNIRGDNLSLRKTGALTITTLYDAVITSDSLLITADRIEQHENEQLDTVQYHLFDNVRVVEGTTTITGDFGRLDRESEIATVTGDVRIVDGDVEVTCEEAAYNRRTQHIMLGGDVVILQEENRIEAQRIDFNRETKFAEGFVDVAVFDLEGNSVLRGQHGTFDNLLDEAEMDTDPSLVSVEDNGDTVTVVSRLMRQRRHEGLSIAVGDVHYTRGRTEAFCDSAAYFHDLDFLAVFGQPEVAQGGSRLSGEDIDMQFDGSELKTMTIKGKALFRDEPADPRVFPGLQSEISGDRFEISFAEGEIRQVEVSGNPRSLYIPEVTDRASINEAAGDSMVLRFAEGDISEVMIFGEAHGEYRYLDRWETALRGPAPDSLAAGTGDPPAGHADGHSGAPADNPPAGPADGRSGASAGNPPVGSPGGRPGAPTGDPPAGPPGERPGAPADSLAAAAPAGGDSASVAIRSGGATFSDLALRIGYKSRDIVYDAREERVYLEREAEVENADFTLMARSIRFDARDDFLDARGEPVLIDKEDRLHGEIMEYSIPDKEGLVYGGVTRYGEGFYSGDKLKRLGQDVVNVDHSIYTTCDLEHPHYHFKIDRIQVQTHDKMVGAPVRFYLGRIPLFYLPFIFNNLERGRRSGFIQPDFEFGISAGSGHPDRFIRDLGYYFAISDYADLQSRFDFNEGKSLHGRLSFRYYQRYFMSGSVRNNLSYHVSKYLTDGSRSWGLRGTHAQNFGTHTRLNANIDYASSSSIRDDINHYSVQEVIDQRLTSSVSLTRRWNNASISTSYSRTQILNQDENEEDDDLLVKERIPFTISTTSVPLWPGGAGGLAGLLAKVKLQPRLSYSQSRDTYEDRKIVSESASTGSSLSFKWKLGFLQIQPSVSANESWSRSNRLVSETTSVPFGKPDVIDPVTPLSPLGESGLYDTDTIEVEQGSEWSHTWSAQAGASTKFYGIFYPKIGDLSGLRHTLAPRLSWRYSETRGESTRLSRTMSLSLSNTLDLKFGEGDKVRRMPGVFSWDLRTNYDMEKDPDEDPWGSLSSSMRLSPFSALSLSMNYSHDLNENRKLSSSINGTLRLSGRFNYGRIEKVDREQNVVSAYESSLEGSDAETDAPEGEMAEEDDDFNPFVEDEDVWGDRERGRGAGGQAQSWNLGVSFSLNQTSSASPSPSLALGGGINLTENWKVDYRTSLDLAEGALNGQTLNLTRDLHCWEATFSRLVINGVEQYYFRIFLKAHPDDIKIESGDRSAGYGYR